MRAAQGWVPPVEKVNPITRGTHTQAPQRHWRGINNQFLDKRSIFCTFKFSCGWDPKPMSHRANPGARTHTHSHTHMWDLGADGTSVARWVEHHPAGVCPSPPCTISIYFHLPNWAPLWVGSLTQQVFRCVLTSWPWTTHWTSVSSSVKMEENITYLQIPRVDWDVWTHRHLVNTRCQSLSLCPPFLSMVPFSLLSGAHFTTCHCAFCCCLLVYHLTSPLDHELPEGCVVLTGFA